MGGRGHRPSGVKRGTLYAGLGSGAPFPDSLEGPQLRLIFVSDKRRVGDEGDHVVLERCMWQITSPAQQELKARATE